MVEPRILLLDTGPLRELILYAAVRDLGYSRLQQEMSFLKTAKNYENLTAFISLFRQRVTTPHVVSEVSAWIIRTIEGGRPLFWSLVFDELTRMEMNEETIALLRMAPELVASLGATDVSLLKVAANFPPGTSLLLSVDDALVKQCKNAGLLALHLWEVID